MPSLIVYIHAHLCKGNKTHQQTPNTIASLKGR